MTNIIDSVAGLLGPLAPFAKAVVPAAIALGYAIVRSVADQSVDAVAISTGVSGLVLAVVTFLVPNKAKHKAKRA